MSAGSYMASIREYAMVTSVKFEKNSAFEDAVRAVVIVTYSRLYICYG